MKNEELFVLPHLKAKQLYAKKNHNVMDEKEKLNVLIAQYTIAVDLYKHEDSLNWKKFEHLFYINAGLLAVLGFVLEKSTIPSENNMKIMTLIAGFLVCLIFSIAIWYGTKYMLNRKDRVLKIEEKLEEYGALNIVKQTESNSFLKTSPTVAILRLSPILLMFIWLILLVLQF